MKLHNKNLFPRYLFITGMSILVFYASCGNKGQSEDDSATASQTPVTVISLVDSTLNDYIYLSATATILKKNFVKSNANGYVQQVNGQLGRTVTRGQLLFAIKTKEAQSIGNAINVLDSSFKFSGVNNIRASSPGYISQLNHQTGDYVADGEPLAVINDQSSFIFLMQLPYELRRFVSAQQSVDLTLPDGMVIHGHINSFMPSVDTLAQTEGVIVKLDKYQPLPENLIAKARLVKSTKTHAISLPMAAVLSNETQTEFWVMKLINANTAVKVLVKEGIQSAGRVEILSPTLSKQDKIIVNGNYGLADTAKVKIVN